MGGQNIGLFRGIIRGPGSVVGIATANGLDGPGIEIFRTSPDRP